ncbi:Uncharacterised protein [Serratia marcescens]|nr:Uncharacterised protein [Serratia marcescens]
MQHITDFNPWLPDTQQVTPAREGGNGQIHQPGQFRNVIWQNVLVCRTVSKPPWWRRWKRSSIRARKSWSRSSAR